MLCFRSRKYGNSLNFYGLLANKRFKIMKWLRKTTLETNTINSWREQSSLCQRTWAEVDLDAILENVHRMKQNIGEKANFMCVIKTNAYGHGAVEVARCLEPVECVFGFAVAAVEEALELKKAGICKPVLILGYTFPSCYDLLAENGIRPAVFREDMIELLAAAGRRIGQKVKVHVKVDTGMSRVGITPDEDGIAFLRKILQYPELEIEGIFTHFSKADEAEKTETFCQWNAFRMFAENAEEQLDIRIPVKHCANSAGILELPDTAMDMMRAGISLYGLYPSEEMRRDNVILKPALSWYSRIVYIKELPAGRSVSYGGTFTAQKDMRVATLSVGYGDGYPRSLSGKGYVLLHGRKAPILGRVCMDQIMIDVTEIPQAKEDDMVTLIGCEGNEEINAEFLGELSGRFHYELLCCIGDRVPRIHIRNGKMIEK